jgi:hypothetical protein
MVRKTHCNRGHERTPSNLDRWGKCRECVRINNRAFQKSHPERNYARPGYKREWSAANPERKAFHGAKTRCTDPNADSWKYYGGRGIEFRFESFNQFLLCVGERPGPEYSLERINPDGHYEPGNVRWATTPEQARNKRKIVLDYEPIRIILGFKQTIQGEV